jgi:hypothetical protein
MTQQGTLFIGGLTTRRDPRGGISGRGDFSRWIADLFGDHAFARELQGRDREDVQSGQGMR